jgi:hypothetical protein
MVDHHVLTAIVEVLIIIFVFLTFKVILIICFNKINVAVFIYLLYVLLGRSFLVKVLVVKARALDQLLNILVIIIRVKAIKVW